MVRKYLYLLSHFTHTVNNFFSHGEPVTEAKDGDALLRAISALRRQRRRVRSSSPAGVTGDPVSKTNQQSKLPQTQKTGIYSQVSLWSPVHPGDEVTNTLFATFVVLFVRGQHWGQNIALGVLNKHRVPLSHTLVSGEATSQQPWSCLCLCPAQWSLRQ